MNLLKTNTENSFKQALEAAGLGWFEYCRIENKITLSQSLCSWLNINYDISPITEFIELFDNSNEISTAISEAFISDSPDFTLELYPLHNSLNALRADCQFTSEKSFVAVVQPIVIARDVHNQNCAINESKSREDELKSIVESAPFPIGVYIGRELRIKIANNAMIDAWGKGHDVIGKLYTDILPELENQQIFNELQNVLDSGIALHKKNTKVILVRAGVEEVYYFNYSFTPLFDANGQVYGVMNTAADVTNLILAQNRSQQNEMKFAKLLETAPAAIGVFAGKDFVIETHNRKFADVVGKGNDIIGKPLSQVMPELIDEGQPFLKILEDVYNTGIPFEAFGTLVKIVQQGVMTSNFYNFTYTPMFDENGAIYAILDIAVDVTENVHAQNKVLESEKSLRNTILKAPVAMCILKQPNFVVEIANDKMIDIWQVDPSVIGMPIFEYLPDARLQGFEELLLRVVNNGETITASERLFTRIINQEVHNLYIDFIYEPFRDSEDNITGVIVVAHDVTQQVLARRKIEEAEARARLAIEAGDLGVYELNFETDELISSKRFDKIWGVEKTENRSQLANKIHPDDLQNRLVAHNIALKTGNLDYEARLIKDDGTTAWFRAKGKVLLGDDGVATTLIGVVQDITEQKLFSEELTRLVRQRTTELERSNEDLQQFAHVASHDLKEPVRKIKFYSNMLQDQFSELLPPKALMHLDKIQNATDRMFSMIEGVLKYSSLQGASKDIETIDLNTTFAHVESDLEVIIKNKNVHINRDQLPVIEGVTVLIHQLFYNIINNALKFSTVDKQPIIDITSEIVEISNQDAVKITIADNGIGLDPEYIGKIFNPLIRLNPKDQYEGTGLGLSLCKKITEQHHGLIAADGAYGVGATFTITLPIKQV